MNTVLLCINVYTYILDIRGVINIFIDNLNPQITHIVQLLFFEVRPQVPDTLVTLF